jgi:hypothetical protein
MIDRFLSRITPRTRTLILAGGAFLLVYILWQWSSQTVLLYPLRLFVTFVHETGHGLTALITGGRFDHFEVLSNGAGVAYTAGGSPFLVLQMGYLGAALFGAILLYAANRVQRVNAVAAIVGLFFAGCAILFTGSGKVALLAGTVGAVGLWLLSGRLKRWQGVLRALAALAVFLTVVLLGSEIALAVGIIGGALLIALGIYASRAVTIFVLNILAFITGFNAINDVWSLMNNRTASLGTTRNDALAMAQFTNVPVEFWIVLWTGLAIIMMGIAIYLSFIRPHRP